MKKYLAFISVFLILFSNIWWVVFAELPFAVTAEKVVVAWTTNGQGGRVEIKDGKIADDIAPMYDGQVEAQMGGINYRLTFRNVGTLKKDTAWFFKTDYSDATLSLSYDFIKARRNNKWDPEMLWEMFNTDEFYEFEEIDTPNIQGTSVNYHLKFSGWPHGEFSEVKPYVDKKHPLHGNIENNWAKVSFNFTWKHRFFNNRSLDMPRTVPWNPFGGWFVGVYEEKEETPPCKDSGIRFSDYEGEVMIRPDRDEDARYGAELDMVLCVDDHVKTWDGSTCVLSLADMTTFIMKPESELILSEVGEQSKISLIGGKIRTNVKRMVKDGTMDVEMSQAVAGIKGTTFVVEETGDSSTLKVIKGEVAFTSKSTGKSQMVNAGEMVTATAEWLGSNKILETPQEEKTREGITVDGSSTLRVSAKLPKNREEALARKYTREAPLNETNNNQEKKSWSVGVWVLIIVILWWGIYVRKKKKKTTK